MTGDLKGALVTADLTLSLIHILMGIRDSPYQWPMVGEELSHIANARLEEVKAFLFRIYAPNNAILAVTGNISFEEAVALTEKWFASIPRREVPLRNLPQEQEQDVYKRQEWGHYRRSNGWRRSSCQYFCECRCI